MARGMAPRGAGGGGRPQPPRRATGGQRGGAAKTPGKVAGRTAGKSTSVQRNQAQLQRTQLVAQQRQAAAQQAAARQQQRQMQAIRDAHALRRRQDAEKRTAQLRQQVEALESILANGLRRSAQIDLDALSRSMPAEEPFDPGALAHAAPEPVWEDFDPEQGWSGRLGGQARRQRRREEAQAEFAAAVQRWREAEQQRQEQLAAAQAAHEQTQAARRAQVEAYRSRIARVAAGLTDREPAAVESFLRTVLRRVPLPADFPHRYEVTHDPATERVTVRLVLPDQSVIPTVASYEYQVIVDKLAPVPRPVAEAAALYDRVVAQVVLLVLRDVYEAEPVLAGVTVHGLLDRIDPDTGKPEFALLTRVVTDRATFTQVPLIEQPPEQVLRQVGGELSSEAYAGRPLQ